MIEAELRKALASRVRIDSVNSRSSEGDLPLPTHLYVAYSGGLDSTVLLCALASLTKEFALTLTAIHVHHGLSPNADDWLEHCRAQCAQLGVPLISECVDLLEQKGSLEEAARKARYQVFARVVKPSSADRAPSSREVENILVLAHHLDDQIETVLMRILRGGDASLLAAIPATRELNETLLLRPLLSVSRKELELYAKEHALTWVEDESNADVSIERNRIRRELLPRLLNAEPTLSESLSKLAVGHASVNALSARMFDCFMQDAKLAIYNGEQGISLARLQSYSQEAQEFIVRCWLSGKQLPQPNSRVFERIWTELISAPMDAQPLVNWGKIFLRRFAGGLFIEKSDGSQAQDCSLGSLALRDGLELREGDSFIAWRESPASVKIEGKTKKAWQKQLAIPPWQRQALYILVRDEGAIAVFDKRAGRRVI